MAPGLHGFLGRALAPPDLSRVIIGTARCDRQVHFRLAAVADENPGTIAVFRLRSRLRFRGGRLGLRLGGLAGVPGFRFGGAFSRHGGFGSLGRLCRIGRDLRLRLWRRFWFGLGFLTRDQRLGLRCFGTPFRLFGFGAGFRSRSFATGLRCIPAGLRCRLTTGVSVAGLFAGFGLRRFRFALGFGFGGAIGLGPGGRRLVFFGFPGLPVPGYRRSRPPP